MTRTHRWALLAILAVGTCAAPSAHAQTANSAAAESLFNEGRALLGKGDFAAACDRFARSDQLDPAVGTLLNLGECYEHLGKTASAWLAFRRAVTLADRLGDARRATRARDSAAALEPKLSRVTVSVAGAAPPGLTVSVNGTGVETAALGTAVPVDPGLLTVEATAPARKPWRTSVDVTEGGSAQVAIPELEAPPPPRDPLRNVALGLDIGGGVVLVAGLVFGGLAAARWSSVEDTCPSARCPSQAARDAQLGDADAARTLSTVSTIATIAGVAGIGAGVVLHLTAPRRRVAVAPAVGATDVGLRFTFGL